MCSSALCSLWMQHRFPFTWEESSGAVRSCKVCLCVDVCVIYFPPPPGIFIILGSSPAQNLSSTVIKQKSHYYSRENKQLVVTNGNF